VIDEDIDTGPILAQRPVPWHLDDTFARSYDRLRAAVEALFDHDGPEFLDLVPSASAGREA
jgi:hypothetical protein